MTGIVLARAHRRWPTPPNSRTMTVSEEVEAIEAMGIRAAAFPGRPRG